MFIRKLIKVAALEATIIGAVYAYKNYGKAIKSVVKDYIDETMKKDDKVVSAVEEVETNIVNKPVQQSAVTKSSAKTKVTKKVDSATKATPKKTTTKANSLPAKKVSTKAKTQKPVESKIAE